MNISVILDNIRSAYNVGSFFRTADGAGIEKLYLCGFTPPSYHPKVAKTALGANENIPSEHSEKTEDAIKQLKEDGYEIYAVELTENAKNFQDVEYPKKVAFLFGHEVDGISEELIEMCDKTIYIPMRGKKKSLNVATTAGVIMYEATRSLN